MIRNLTIIVLIITYPLETQSAKMEYHSPEEIESIGAPEVNSHHWEESSSLQHGQVEITADLHLLRAKQNSGSSPDTLDTEQPSNKSEHNFDSQLKKIDFLDIQSEALIAQNAEKVGFTPLISQIHFDLLSESKGLMTRFIDANDNLDLVIEDTVNLARQVNTAWNNLDDQITHKLYQGLGYIGGADAFQHGDNPYIQPLPNHFNEALNNPGGIPEIENDVESNGFLGLILKLPKLFTFNNFMILMGLMLAGNGMFRVIRYIVLRL